MGPTEARLQLLNVFTGLAPVSGVCTYMVDRQGEPHGYLLRNMPTEQIDRYKRSFGRCDPLHPSKYLTDSRDLVNLDSLARTPDATSYVTGFLNAQDLQHELQLFLRDASGRIFAGIGLFRDEQKGPFRSSEMELLRRVHPLAECTLRAHFDEVDETVVEPWRTAFHLTAREIDVLELIRRGASNAFVAQSLGIKLSTVKVHVFNIFSKTGVSSRTELLAELYAGADAGAQRTRISN